MPDPQSIDDVGGVGGQPPPPDPTAPPPDRPTLMQAPPETESVEQQLRKLFAQSQALQTELRQPVEESVRSKMTGSLKDLNTYVDSQYQAKYGGGGKAGAAKRFLADLLRGHDKPTLKEQSDTAAEKDYKAAMTEVTQQVLAEKASKQAQLQAIHSQAAVLGPVWQQEQKLKAEQANRDRIADLMAAAKDETGKPLHSAKQIAEARLGRNLSTVQPRVLSPDVLGEDAGSLLTLDGKHGVKGIHYRVESADNPDGAILIPRGNPSETTRVIPLAVAKEVFPGATSTTGWVAIKYDSQNKPVGEPQPAAPNPAYAPQVTERPVTIGDQVQALPFKTQRQMPGTEPSAAPGAPQTAPPPSGPPSVLPGILPPPNSPGTPTTPPFLPGPRPVPASIGRVLGISPAAQRRNEENPLDASARTTLESTAPVVDQVKRAMSLLETRKNDNGLLDRTTMERLAYAFGFKPDDADLISNLELGRVNGAARILKGSSRALPALELAMKHLPDTKVDTYAKQYSQLENIMLNLKAIEKAAVTYGQKYPGRKSGAKLPDIESIAFPNASGAAPGKVRVYNSKTGAFD